MRNNDLSNLSMLHSRLLLSLFFLLFSSVFISNLAIADEEKMSKMIYSMKAGDARLIRHVTGPVTESIRGVPAIPVDSFLWSGENIIDIKGHAKLEIDPVTNMGKISAHWEDEYGHWSYHQDMFVAPAHPTGVKMGSSVTSTMKVMGDPVTTDIYLHGDTSAGAPVIPTVFNFLSTWGPAKVMLNDEVFPNTFDETPMWPGHTMISEGVRAADGSVRTTSGDLYTMMKKSEGITFPEDMAFHLVFHSMPGAEMTGNIPPPVGFFYHVSFSKVKLKIKHKG